MPKTRRTEIGKRSTYFCTTSQMWVLQTLDKKKNKVVEDQFMNSRDQAEAWVKGKLGEGDCYEIASKLLFNSDHTKEGYILCHGTVVGQGPIEGAIFGHAWLEYKQRLPMDNNGILNLDMVLDHSNGKRTSMPKDLYYKIGRIKNVKKYTKEEARKMLLTELTYGPWK
jgi:hypothetical protein